jgi:hypothetical protein
MKTSAVWCPGMDPGTERVPEWKSKEIQIKPDGMDQSQVLSFDKCDTAI